MSNSVDLFLGRDAEIDALERVLEGGVRVATIVGPLGAGKTRLAREFCARRGDATCFIDLTDVFEQDAFLRRVASRIGVSLSDHDPVDQLASALEASDLDVVVLDNAEQIIGVCRSVVRAFVERPSIPQVLVTSREALGLSAEVRIALGALNSEDAVRLFERRAREAVPDFAVSDSDRETVSQMLGELDNLPLVIELAASRAAMLPPTQLLKRLSDRFRLVREKQSQRTPRQASLEGAIAWSWDLLDESERRALTRSSVFRGGFSLEAAEAVLDGDAIALVDALVSKSLLRRESSARDALDVRFRHYESIRAFAAERLDADDAYDAHASYFGELAHQLGATLRNGGDTAAQANALGQLDEELGNLLAALAHSGDAAIGLAVDLLLEARGPARMRQRVLKSFESTGDEEQQRLLSLAETELAQGRIDAARAWLHDARSIGETARTALTAARIERAAGDASASASHARSAIERTTDAGLEARARASLAVVTDDLSEARDQCDVALRLLARDEDARLSLMVRNVAGSVAMRALDLDTAAAHFARVLPDAAALGESRLEAAALSNLALVEHYRGQLEDAATRFADAQRVFRRVGLRAEAAMASGNRAAVLLELEQFDEAAAELAEADESLGGRGGPVEGVVLATRGNLHHVRGELHRALELYDRASARLSKPSPHAAATSVYAAIAARELGEQREIADVGLFPTWGLARDAIEGNTPKVHEELAAKRHGLPRYVAEGFDAWLSGTTHPWLFVTLMRRLPTERLPVASTVANADLLLDENGYWFEVEGERVDIRRRGPARLLLLAMVEQHLEQPGVAFDLDDLFEVGWPGQNIDIEAAYKRVYAAIGTLRRLGLEDLIVTTDDGYLIAPTTAVTRQ